MAQGRTLGLSMSAVTVGLAILVALPGVTAAQPNLVVTSIKCDPTQGKLAFTVRNVGSGLRKDWRAVADVYFDGVKRGFYDLTAPTTGSLIPAGGMASYLTALDVVAPVRVRVVADPTNDVHESNELDNAMVRTVQPCAKPRRPDLIVRITGPASAAPGEVIGDRVKVDVKNVGAAPAPGTDSDPNGYMVDVVLSTDAHLPITGAVVTPAFTEDMLVIGGRISHTTTLAPGASTTYALGPGGLTLPAKIKPGKYCLGAVADPFDKVAESREGNNTSCAWLVIK